MTNQDRLLTDLIAVAERLTDWTMWANLNNFGVDCLLCGALGDSPDEVVHIEGCPVEMAEKALWDNKINQPAESEAGND